MTIELNSLINSCFQEKELGIHNARDYKILNPYQNFLWGKILQGHYDKKYLKLCLFDVDLLCMIDICRAYV